ncbi:hypothetical protein [Pseudorhodoferax sp. Leaf267]|uniref:hypothetical protein n=1 Tax=Pseudorhodoferax sp. Leaf267 TaxID=1736316 RepID=UPI0006F7CF6E|nr:hypothetical protein [Pseudorhodoferax sp. Leaf267]KQP21725.1 hypothetical protein ASF43_25830 [Pseudorhodoferax sp. Leaf267]
MNEAIAGWKEAAKRADAVRARVDGLARAGVPVSRALLVELVQLEAAVVARLEAVQAARVAAGPMQ